MDCNTKDCDAMVCNAKDSDAKDCNAKCYDVKYLNFGILGKFIKKIGYMNGIEFARLGGIVQMN